MFCDQTTLQLHAGNGGNGCISFRREKFVPRGGPNGGNGGKGGDIYFKVNHALNTLTHLDSYKQFRAEGGEHGMGQNCFGKNAEDLILEVPLGTIVRQVIRDKKDEVVKKMDIADLSSPNKILLAAKGGVGGKGNANFASSVRQAPKFAELGEEGENIEVELELKLVADVGIIGVPSAGKSSLIAAISNARPKIADYPFTTLIPNLGIVKIADKVTYVVADIPGLIENAHEGKGLGVEFLKHVQRCRVLVHLIDPSQADFSEQKSNFQLINQELAAFSKDLAEKKQIVVINKVDLLQEEQEKDIRAKLKQEIGRSKRFTLYPESISAATTKGTQELKIYLFQQLEKTPKPDWQSLTPVSEEHPVHILYRPHLENPQHFSVELIKKGVYRVSGKRIEQIVNMTNFDNREASHRVHDVLYKKGILKELKKLGAKDGDKLLIGKHKIEFFFHFD
ncbi:MAG: GTPase ObgE [bacterium]|nr:GTPase ObgE [bacterium]